MTGSGEIEVQDFSWALFDGDTRVTSWIPSGTTTISGPGVTVTEIRYRFLGQEIRRPLSPQDEYTEVHPGKVTMGFPSENRDPLFLYLEHLGSQSDNE